MQPELWGTLTAVTVIVIVVRLVVRRRLLVKYAALWLTVSIALFILGAVPTLINSIADALGFAVPANLLFFAGFGLMLLVTLQLSVELTRIEARIQRLAEDHALANLSRPVRAAGDSTPAED